MPPLPHPLLIVGRCLPLPGLGLLLLADASAPWLAAQPLHTALAVALHRPDGSRHAATATVEEVADADSTPRRALLLADMAEPVLAGTAVWEAAEGAVDAYAGLQ